MRPALKAATPHGTGLPPRVRQNFPDHGSSMLATTRNASPHTWQVSLPGLNTRVRRCTRFTARLHSSVPEPVIRRDLPSPGLFGASKRKKTV